MTAVPLLRKAAILTPESAVIHRYLGYALWRSNKEKSAVAEFRIALRLDPKDPYTLYFLGRIAESQGRVDEAIKRYNTEVTLGLPVYDTYRRLGQAYANKGQLQKAEQLIELSLQQTPWDGGIHYQLGRLYQKTGQMKEAQEQYRIATRLGQSDQTSIQELLQLSMAIRNGEADRIFKLRDELLRQNPGDPEIMNSLGVMLGHSRLYASALDPLQKAVRILPNSYESNYNLGLTLLKLGRSREAEMSLKKALAVQPDSFDANIALATLYADEGRVDETIKTLRQACKIRPHDAKVLALLGQQYLQAHHVGRAIMAFRESWRNGRNREVMYLLIEAYDQKSNYRDAYETAKKALTFFPSDAHLLYETANQLANLGRYLEARPYAEKAVHSDPSLVRGYILLANLESQSGEYEMALVNFQKARELDAGNLPALMGIGEILTRLKHYREAVEELNKSVKFYPESAELHLALSKAYKGLGDSDKARKEILIFQKLHVAKQKRALSRPDLKGAGQGKLE